jgi:hypothetical protein
MMEVEIPRETGKNAGAVSSRGSAGETEIRRKASLKKGSGESASKC